MLAKRRELVCKCALERRSRLPALQISVKIVEPGHEVRMAKKAQDGDHHQVADAEAVAFQPLLVAEPVGNALELQPRELGRSLAPQLRPFLARVEDVDQ